MITQTGLSIDVASKAKIALEARRCRMDIVDTVEYRVGMSKAHASSSARPEKATIAVAQRSSAVETKGSINLRIESGTRRLIDDAAAVLGKTRTEFMVETARRQAIDVLLDQRMFELDSDRFDAFTQALDNPPAPGPKLRSLVHRVPAWRK